MRSKILLLLIAAATLWSTPAAADDPGKARVTIHLESSQSIPEDVRDGLFDKLKVAIRCDGKKISEDEFKVGKPRKKPEIRGLSASKLPPGSCTVLAGIDDNKARVALKIKSGKTATGKVVIKLGWARVAVDQLLDGDKAFLVWTDKKDRAKALPLTTEPLLVTLRDYSYVLEHDGERLDPVELSRLKGDTTIKPYGSIAFSNGVLIDGAQITVDGEVVEADGNTLTLPLGKHTVEVAAVARRPVSKDVTLKAGKPYRWSTRLSKAKPGKITFEVDGPDTWTLSIDTVETDAAEEAVLDTGPHVISISADGYDTLTETLTVEEREKRTASFTLTPTAIALTLSPLPEGAKLRIAPTGGSAEDIDVSGDSITKKLAPGQYAIHVEAEDFVSFDQKVTLNIGEGSRSLEVDMPSMVVRVTWTGASVGSVAVPGGAGHGAAAAAGQPRRHRQGQGLRRRRRLAGGEAGVHHDGRRARAPARRSRADDRGRAAGGPRAAQPHPHHRDGGRRGRHGGDRDHPDGGLRRLVRAGHAAPRPVPQ